MRQISRRTFVKASGGAIVAAAATAVLNDLAFLQVVPDIPNPLGFYPNRGWERVYRDLYQVDSEYTFLCAPNDTHNCLLTAKVRNGVVTRIEPTYKYGKATDNYGNQASQRWDPRACSKGLGLTRMFYGDRRVKGAMVRNAGISRH